MEFSPFNNVVKICLQGMEMEEKGEPEEARKLFLQGCEEATNGFEKLLGRKPATLKEALKELYNIEN